MRIPGRVALALAAAALSALALDGCAAHGSSAAPSGSASSSSTPVATPVFASDADALAAATAAYKKFEQVSDEIGHGGWKAPEMIRPYVSDTGYQHALKAAEEKRAQHAKAYGQTVVNNTKLQSYSPKDGGFAIRIYVCEDLSGVDVRDELSGTSLVAPDRSDFVAYLAEFTGRSAESLVLDDLSYWSGGGICKA